MNGLISSWAINSALSIVGNSTSAFVASWLKTSRRTTRWNADISRRSDYLDTTCAPWKWICKCASQARELRLVGAERTEACTRTCWSCHYNAFLSIKHLIANKIIDKQIALAQLPTAGEYFIELQQLEFTRSGSKFCMLHQHLKFTRTLEILSSKMVKWSISKSSQEQIKRTRRCILIHCSGKQGLSRSKEMLDALRSN